MTDADDVALLRAVAAGSEQAFNRLVDRHQQALRTFLRKLVRRDEAEDLAQESFLVVWQQAGTFRGGSSVRSWLFAIAWRKAKGMQRGWFRRLHRDTSYLEMTQNEVDETPAELRLAVERALAILPLPQRAAVMLCLAHGFTHAEAAVTLEMPLGTIKSHVARGRARLQEVLGDNDAQ